MSWDEKNNCIIITKGSVFIISSGEYSDYEALVICEALEDINPKELQEEYYKKYPQQLNYKETEYSEFIENAVKWMVEERKCIKRLNAEDDVEDFHLQSDYDKYEFTVY